jgi:hypothetical protein
MRSAKSTRRFLEAMYLGATVAFCGCASIISGRHADVTFQSNAPHAHVVVRDKRGMEVANAATPSTIALKRKDKFIFPARYMATFEAPGYQPAEVPIHSTVNPWILGNVVVGGIPGLVVDNVTGAVWKPCDSTVYQPLVPLHTAGAGRAPAGSLPPNPHAAALPSPAWPGTAEQATMPDMARSKSDPVAPNDGRTSGPQVGGAISSGIR